MAEPEEVNSFQVKVESNPLSETRIHEISVPEPESPNDSLPDGIPLYGIPSLRQPNATSIQHPPSKNPHKTFNPSSSKHLSETRRWTEKHAEIVGNTSSGQQPRNKCYTTGKIDFKHSKRRFRDNAGQISKLVPTPENVQNKNVPVSSLLNRRNCNLPSLPNFYDDIVTDCFNPSDFRVRSASLEHGQLKHARNHHPISKEQLRYQQEQVSGSPATNEESNTSIHHNTSNTNFDHRTCTVLTQNLITQRRRIQNFIQSVPETIKSRVESVKVEEKPHWTLCHEFSVESKSGNDRDGLKAIDYPHVPFSLLETGINTVSNQRKMQPKSCQDRIREIIRDPHSSCNQEYYWDWVNKLDADEYIQTCPGLNQGAFLVRPDGQSHSKGYVLVVKFKPGVTNEKRKLPIFHDLDTNKLSIPLEPLEDLTFDYLEEVIHYLRDNFIDLFTGVSYREVINTENCLMLTKQEVTRWNFNKHGKNEKYGRKTDEYDQFTPDAGYKLEFDKNELFAQYINTSKRKRILEEEEYDLQGDLELKRGQFVTANRERLKSLSLLEMYTTHLELCTESSRQWMEFERERVKDWDRPKSIEPKSGHTVKFSKNKSDISLANSNSSRIGSMKSLSSGSTLTNAEVNEKSSKPVNSKQVSHKQVSSKETTPKKVNFEQKSLPISGLLSSSKLKQQIKQKKPDPKQSIAPKTKVNSDENPKNSMISGLFKNMSSKSKNYTSKNSSPKNLTKKSDLKQEIVKEPNLKNDKSEILSNANTNSTNPDQIRMLSENTPIGSSRYPRRRNQGTMSTTTSQSGILSNSNMMESSQKIQLPKGKEDHFIPGSTMYRTRERLNQRIELVSEHYKQTRERYFNCDQKKDDVEIRLTEIRRELSVINEQYLAACWILQYKYNRTIDCISRLQRCQWFYPEMSGTESDEILKDLPVGSFLVRKSSQKLPENADYEIVTLVVNVLRRHETQDRNVSDWIRMQIFVSLEEDDEDSYFDEKSKTDEKSETNDDNDTFSELGISITPMPGSKYGKSQESVNLTKYRSLLTKRSCGLLFSENKNNFPSIAKMLLYHNVIPIELSADQRFLLIYLLYPVW